MDGAKSIRIFDDDVAVRAKIHVISGFSAHADQKGLLAWRNVVKGVNATFLVHGEQAVMQTFAKLLPGGRIEMPAPNQAFDL